MRKIVFQRDKTSLPSLLLLTRHLISFSCILFLISCASYKLEKNLDPESKEFLSIGRYIITKQERKIFLNLSPSEKEAFIKDFWKKRDPDPDTEENEFKEEYFNRIEEANHLFKEGGTPGWLQDRGRIYILLGPPERREVYPRGRTFYGKPMEIWYYGFFPIYFIDYSDAGIFKLQPLSAHHISEINKAQMELKPKIKAKKIVFDFNINVKKIEEDKALIQIEVPYKNIWFIEEDNKLKTTLEFSMEIFDSSGKKVWKHHKTHLLSLAEENLEDIIEKNYVLKFEVNLKHGDYTLTTDLENRTDESRIRKKTKFTI